MKKNILILVVIVFTTFNSFAQLKFGADIYSRYNWRGLDFGNAPAFQPSLAFTVGGFSIGAWGSYAFPTTTTTYAENDLYASYAFSIVSAGNFTLLFTDYYYPSAGIKFSDFEKNGGAHTMEAGVTYSGPEKFPISLALYLNIHNDVDNSSYIQIGYPFSVYDATITLAAGFVPSKSAYYVTNKANLINLNITAAKSIAITDKFSIPINVSYIANPALDITYLVFGASFTF
ncbi:MAG: hypothetical protein FIA82_08915 [Melioribacter sp.]|nr:hypothetical protein [Melioribacter sp.]